MLIFYREVDRRDLGKTNEKNVVYVGFFIAFFGRFLAVHQIPIRFFDLIDINNEEFTPFNRFCVWPS